MGSNCNVTRKWFWCWKVHFICFFFLFSCLEFWVLSTWSGISTKCWSHMTARPGLTMSYKKNEKKHKLAAGHTLECLALACYVTWQPNWAGRTVLKVELFDNDCPEKRTFLMTKQNYVQKLYTLYKAMNIYKILSGFRRIAQKTRNTCTIGCENAFHLFVLIFNVFFKALQRSFLTEIHWKISITYIIVNFGWTNVCKHVF